MGVRVRTIAGFLGLRIFWRGRDLHVGTKLRDVGGNRRLLEAKAEVIDERIAAGVPLHRVLLDVLGDCPPRLLPRRERRSLERLRDFHDVWIESQKPPLLRKIQARKRRRYFETLILPELGGLTFDEIDRMTLESFRARLLGEEIGPKSARRTRGLKTVRNVIDDHLRALWRAAEASGVAAGPFPRLEWRKLPLPKPDPFDSAERDRIVGWFAANEAWLEPWVSVLFWTGLRHGEAAALRWTHVDLARGSISVERSRTEREENAPKTTGSTREVRLLAPAIEALKRVPRELHSDGTEHVFRTPEGKPMGDTWWPKRGAARRPKNDAERGVWARCLRSLGIRPRRAYCTRHTFIAWALTEGANLKGLAEFCGTSVAMIERRYGRYMRSDFLAPLEQALDRTGNFPVSSPDHRRKSAISSLSGERRKRGKS